MEGVDAAPMTWLPTVGDSVGLWMGLELVPACCLAVRGHDVSLSQSLKGRVNELSKLTAKLVVAD